MLNADIGNQNYVKSTFSMLLPFISVQIKHPQIKCLIFKQSVRDENVKNKNAHRCVKPNYSYGSGRVGSDF